MKTIFRSYQTKDREAVRHICMQTGMRGKPARLFFEDEEVLPRLFADYYLQYEPENCYVIEVDGDVVGYLLCCRDTRVYNRVMITRFYPLVSLRIFIKIITLQYRQKRTFRTLWWVISRGYRERLTPDLDQYPAHIHINILPEYVGNDIGRLLMLKIGEFKNQKVTGTHLIVRETENDNRLSSRLMIFGGWKIAQTKRNTVWEPITGKKWFAKLLVLPSRQTNPE